MLNVIRNCYKLSKLQKYKFHRKYSTQTTKPSATKSVNTISFDEFVAARQQQAVRSVVVQVSSEKSFPELYNYCKTYGNIVGAHHYCIRYEEVQHYILLEYEYEHEAAAAIDSSAYNEEFAGVPARSPFLWFRTTGKKQLKAESAPQKTMLPLTVLDGNKIVYDLNEILKNSSNIEDQITLLYNTTKLNDLGIRLRFLAAYQVQKAISGMFPLANALPFGSSVNGFGKMGCDLDLILRLDKECKGSESKSRAESRLVFHTKANLTNGRSQTQRQMESIGDMLQLFLPGVCHVRRILQARIPIIKYHHEHLNLEIDLSMSNLSGFYMSELLYMFGEMDKRVRPLTFCIRKWAQTCGLTNPSPGRWISNFSLTCLVIFFLQQTKQPILPAINTLIKKASPQDIRITEDGINCTFARDLENLSFHTANSSNVSDLLLQFFEFYSQFDFQNKAISLNEAKVIAKPDHSAMFIVNPLEPLLNVSKNVSLAECERLRIEVRNAAWILESELESQHHIGMERNEELWGLLNIIKSPEQAIIRPNMFFKPRILEVSDLFEKQEGQTKKTNATNEDSSKTVQYKNVQVKQQIESIKNTARSDLKQMRLNAALGAGGGGGGNTSTSSTKSGSTKRSR